MKTAQYIKHKYPDEFNKLWGKRPETSHYSRKMAAYTIYKIIKENAMHKFAETPLKENWLEDISKTPESVMAYIARLEEVTRQAEYHIQQSNLLLSQTPTPLHKNQLTTNQHFLKTINTNGQTI